MTVTTTPTPAAEVHIITDFLDKDGVLRLDNLARINGRYTVPDGYPEITLQPAAVEILRKIHTAADAITMVLHAETAEVVELGDYMRGGLLVGLSVMLRQLDAVLIKAGA